MSVIAVNLCERCDAVMVLMAGLVRFQFALETSTYRDSRGSSEP